MIKCKDCGNMFEAPKNTIILARVIYCPDCFRRRLKAIISMPLDDFMKSSGNQVIKRG